MKQIFIPAVLIRGEKHLVSATEPQVTGTAAAAQASEEPLHWSNRTNIHLYATQKPKLKDDIKHTNIFKGNSIVQSQFPRNTAKQKKSLRQEIKAKSDNISSILFSSGEYDGSLFSVVRYLLLGF